MAPRAPHRSGPGADPPPGLTGVGSTSGGGGTLITSATRSQTSFLRSPSPPPARPRGPLPWLVHPERGRHRLRQAAAPSHYADGFPRDPVSAIGAFFTSTSPARGRRRYPAPRRASSGLDSLRHLHRPALQEPEMTNTNVAEVDHAAEDFPRARRGRRAQGLRIAPRTGRSARA